MSKSSLVGFIKSILLDSRVKQMFFCSNTLEGYYNDVLAVMDSITDDQFRKIDFDNEIESLSRFSRGVLGDLVLDFHPFRTVTGNFYDGRSNRPVHVTVQPSTGNLWVISRYGRPAVFDSDWNFLQYVGVWANSGSIAEAIFYPTYASFYVDALGREWFIICSYDYHYCKFFLVDEFDLKHQFTVGIYGHAGVDSSHLFRPYQFAIDFDEKKLYIANYYGRPPVSPSPVRDGYISRYDISGLDADPPTAPVFEDYVLWGGNGSCAPEFDVVCNPLGVAIHGDHLIVSYGGNIAAYDKTSPVTPYPFKYMFQPAVTPYHHNPSPRYIYKYTSGSEVKFILTDITLGIFSIFDETGRVIGWSGARQWEAYMGNPNSPLRFQEPWGAIAYDKDGEMYIAVSDYGNQRVQVGSFTELLSPAEIITKTLEFPRNVELRDVVVKTNIPSNFLRVWYRYGDSTTWFLLEKGIRNVVSNKIQIRIEVGPFINTSDLPKAISNIEAIGVVYRME